MAVTLRDVARHSGVSLRTVNRDLNWLREAGLAVISQHGRFGGVTLLPGAGLDPRRLTPGEREHLALPGLDQRQRRDLDVAGESRRAYAKLGMPRGARTDGLVPLDEVVHVDSRPWFRTEDSAVRPALLIGAIRRDHRLRIEYRSASSGRQHIATVDPYGLLAKAGTWYLVADRNRVPRLYRLDRIVQWQEVHRRRHIRPGQSLSTVTAALTEAWEADHGIEVHARIAVAQLERARRILGQRLEEYSAEPPVTDRVDATIRFKYFEDVRVLLQFGNTVTVLDPPEIVTRLRDLAGEIVEQYRVE